MEFFQPTPHYIINNGRSLSGSAKRVATNVKETNKLVMYFYPVYMNLVGSIWRGIQCLPLIPSGVQEGLSLVNITCRTHKETSGYIHAA